MWRLLSMEDGRLSERVDKWVDMAGQHTEGEIGLCVFPTRATQASPPNSTPLPPLRDQASKPLICAGTQGKCISC